MTTKFHPVLGVPLPTRQAEINMPESVPQITPTDMTVSPIVPAPIPTRARARELRRRTGTVRPVRSRVQALDGTFKSVLTMLGGFPTLYNLIKLAAETNTDAATFVAHYEALADVAKRSINLEDLCAECGFKWPRLVACALEVSMQTGQHLAAIKAAMALPGVVEKSIKFAKREGGHRDREMLFQHSRFIPVPSGSTISIVNQASANAYAKNDISQFVPFERDIMDASDDQEGAITVTPKFVDADA